MYRIVLFAILILSPCYALSAVCTEGDFKSFVMCLVDRHPEAKKASLDREKAERISTASVLDNPEFELETSKGTLNGEKQGSNKFTVSYPIFTGGKIFASKQKNKADAELFRVEGQKGWNSAFVQTVLNIYRLRQIQSEMQVLDEALGAYSRVIRQLGSRPRLDPEREVTLNVIKLAEGDFSFKKAKLQNELRQVEDFFSHIPDLTLEDVKKRAPNKKTNWPTVNDARDSFAGWPMQSLIAGVKKQEAEYGIAKAESWPEVKLGLTMEHNVAGPEAYKTFGFVLSLPLPFFNLNSGPRGTTYSDFQKAEVDLELGKKEVQNERKRLVEFYNFSVKTLEKSPKEQEVQGKHSRVEGQFDRGLLGGSIFIEIHRQLFEFITGQNEIEFKALETLFRVHEIDGTLAGVSL